MVNFLKKHNFTKTDLIKFKIRIAMYLVKKLNHYKVSSKKTLTPNSFTVNSLKTFKKY